MTEAWISLCMKLKHLLLNYFLLDTAYVIGIFLRKYFICGHINLLSNIWFICFD